MSALVLWLVAGLSPATEGAVTDGGVLVLRDEFADEATRPGQGVVVLAAVNCEVLPADRDRWDGRWRGDDDLALRDGGRRLEVTAHDLQGAAWAVQCRVGDAVSCYLPHSTMWIEAAVADGGLDESAPLARVLDSVRAWSGPRACTRARLSRGRVRTR